MCCCGEKLNAAGVNTGKTSWLIIHEMQKKTGNRGPGISIYTVYEIVLLICFPKDY